MEKDWSSFSDEALIEKYRSGEISVADHLVDKYKALVRKKARFYYLEGGDQEDLLQEGMIGLFKAVREYDPNRQASFFTFAELCVNRQMLSAVEAASRKKHTPLNESVSLESMDESQRNGMFRAVDGPETILMENEAADQLLKKIEEKLSPMEREVLGYYLKGMNYQQIAKRMGKKAKSVDNALQRIKGKIRN